MKNKILAGIMAMVFSVLCLAPNCFAADAETGVSVLMAAAYDKAGNDQINPLSPADLAIDKDAQTAWTVFSEAASGYIVLDMGSMQTINTVRFTDLDEKITDYTLEHSTDMLAWKELAIGGSTGTSEKADNFPSVKTRYVKLCINNSMTEQGGGFRIGEIEAYYDSSVNIVMSPGSKRVYKDVLPVGAAGEAIELLSGLGIVRGDDTGYFRPNAPITRGEFARVISNIFAEDMRGGSEPPFADIGSDADLKKAIATVYTYGLMLGDGDGYFRPDDTITGAEAVKVVMALLGYSSIAEESGGYYTGYYVTANKLGILKNTGLAPDKGTTRKQAAILLANAFDVEVLDVIGIQAGDETYNIYAKNDNTILSTYSDIYQERGIVVANEVTALDSGNSTKDGMVQISGDEFDDLFYVGETDASKYLGYEIDFYYQITNSGRDKVIRSFSSSYTVVTEIAPEDIVNYDGSIITYYKDDKSVRKTIEPSAPVIKNATYMGKLAHALTNEELKVDSGKLELIDNDGDGRAEVVNVWTYESGIVESVSPANDLISFKGMVGITYEFDNEKYRIFKDGKRIKAEDLKTFDVISYSKDASGEVTTVFVSPYAGMEGTPETILDDEIVIDGVNHRICSKVNFNDTIYSAADLKKKISLGATYTFYFNIENKIVGVFGGGAKNEYGFLMDVAYNPGVFEPELSLKIFTQSGSKSVYKCDEKVEVGGEKLTVDKVYAKISNGSEPRKQMVRFSTNSSNVITKLTLPDIEAGLSGKIYRNDDSLIPYGDPYQFVKHRFYWKKALGDAATGLKEFAVSDSTIIMQIPESGDEKRYQLVSRETFRDSTNHEVIAYNVGATGEAAIMAVESASAGEVQEATQSYLVTEVVTALDYDGEPVLQFNCVSKGSRLSFQVDEDVVVKQNVRKANGKADTEELTTIDAVKPGSVILYAGNPVGVIKLLYPICGDSTKPDPGWRYSYGWSGEKVFGKVLAVKDNNIALDTGGMTSYYTLDKAVKFHAWDVVRQAETSATVADILSVEDVGEDKASYFYYAPYTKTMFLFNF